MKKRWMKVMTFLLAVPLVLSACGKQGNAEVPSAQKAYNDSLIEEVYQEEGSFNQSGWEETYSMNIPNISADTPDAEAINQQIEQKYGRQVEILQDSIASHTDYYGITQVSWQSFWNGSLLGLVLEVWDSNTGLTSYDVYNYDFASGRAVSNSELLRKMGIQKADFLHAVRCAAAEEFDKGGQPYTMDMYDIVLQYRAEMISPRTVHMDNPIYLDEQGHLHAAVQVQTMAGIGIAYRFVEPVFYGQGQEPPEKTVSSDWLTASLKNNALVLTFKKTLDSGKILPDTIQYNVPYQVQGLYGNYTEVFIGNVHQMPYVFLLSRDGRVSCCDVVRCAQFDYFSVEGPLLGAPESIASFVQTESLDEWGQPCQIVAGVGESGRNWDMTGSILNMECAVPYFMTETRSSSDGRYALTYSMQDGEWIMIQGQGPQAPPLWYTGPVNYMGMTEDGMVYSYLLSREETGELQDKDSYAGVMALDYDYDNGQAMSAKPLKGSQIFGMPLETAVPFHMLEDGF